ncbi:hypothetical protein [Streptomyces griseocarneus]|uniref:hypothetical protein n=1 Tax=Streptomyces griseocarneus TaxID=51201 RepID=UPI00167DD40A|nr:hypothetical protein [Streptomyces griseocarneus]MBZ6476728.1 hypothetical protein [Streptomyces griseocarneus]GHG80571.1 hypothetical protein GCM10018779_62260 [Streptomyces griseocarneus]
MPAAHHKLTVPDHKTLRDEATSQVKEELGKIARPDDRFKRACEIVQQADLEIAAHTEERNQAALSLWFYDGVRGLDKVLGILPNAYSEMRRFALHGDKKATINPGGDLNARMTAEERIAAAQKAGVPRLDPDEASERLPALAATVSVAAARRKAAMPFLQDAALALTEDPYDWSTDRIAKLGNTTPKYVRDVKNKAAKRRGH